MPMGVANTMIEANGGRTYRRARAIRLHFPYRIAMQTLPLSAERRGISTVGKHPAVFCSFTGNADGFWTIFRGKVPA